MTRGLARRIGGYRAPGAAIGAVLAATSGVLLAASAAGPAPVADATPGAAHASDGPRVRVAVAPNRETVIVSSSAGLELADALTGQPAGRVRSYGELRLEARDGALTVSGDVEVAPVGVPSVVIRPTDGAAPVEVDGRPYRGRVEVRIAEANRVTAINVLPLEDYLLGVVPLEIGPREPAELAAVEAQAVAARTYAVSHLGRHAELGFDLYGSVEDQAYGGLDAEQEVSSRAVRNTAGIILMYDGRPIRAYYHSTCGGRTAAVEEVMDREPAPYLRSVSDRAPDGTDYCAASPRYRWSVAWTPQELDRIARRELAAHFGVPASSLGEVRSVEVRSRTPSDRVRDLAFSGPGLDLVLSRLDIRRSLPSDARILNSTNFTVRRADGGLVELDGRGYGHGAGMCQWGAIGRARAGQTFREILATYYPGADLVQAYEGEQG